jgi:hypothetical protein
MRDEAAGRNCWRARIDYDPMRSLRGKGYVDYADYADYILDIFCLFISLHLCRSAIAGPTVTLEECSLSIKFMLKADNWLIRSTPIQRETLVKAISRDCVLY